MRLAEGNRKPLSTKEWVGHTKLSCLTWTLYITIDFEFKSKCGGVVITIQKQLETCDLTIGFAKLGNSDPKLDRISSARIMAGVLTLTGLCKPIIADLLLLQLQKQSKFFLMLIVTFCIQEILKQKIQKIDVYNRPHGLPCMIRYRLFKKLLRFSTSFCFHS